MAARPRPVLVAVRHAPDGGGRPGCLAAAPGIRSPAAGLVPGRYRDHLRGREDARPALLASALSGGVAAPGAGPARADAVLRNQSFGRGSPPVAPRLLAAQ